MHLAITDLFNARWTDEIHEEWISNLLKNRPDLTREKLTKTKDLMDHAVREPKVTDFQSIIPTLMGLPDSGDAHVIAAAIRSNSDAIVTYNIRDFPHEVLNEYCIEAIHPDDFINYQIDLNSALVCKAIKKLRGGLNNPKKSASEYLAIIKKQSLPKTVQALEKFQDLI
jgi:predicted nucleic acid-binding protein